MPSIVLTAPFTEPTGSTQDRTALPSTITVQLKDAFNNARKM